MLGYVPGDRLGFGGTEARTLMRDWAHNGRTARYEPIGSDVNYESALRELQVDLVTVEGAPRSRRSYRSQALREEAGRARSMGSGRGRCGPCGRRLDRGAHCRTGYAREPVTAAGECRLKMRSR